MAPSSPTRQSDADRLSYFEDLFQEPDSLRHLSGVELMGLAVKFKKIEPQYQERHRERLVAKRIAILSSCTTHHLVGVLKLFLYQEGIAPEIREGEYGSIANDLLDPDSWVFAYQPDLLLILPYHTDIREYPPLFATDDEQQAWLDGLVRHYQQLWSAALRLDRCQVMQATFVTQIDRALGNLEANYQFAAAQCLRRLSLELTRRRPAHVTFVDLDYLASYLGKSNWFDEPNFFRSKQGFSLEASGLVAHTIARCYAPHVGRVKKCLVTDLDNTLWGGVIGDDGVEGINVDPHHPVGEAFLAFQKYLKALKDRGVVLAVCSKNDPAVARTPFIQHSDMHLKLDDFACIVANWDDKATNLQRIAQQLDLGLDSLVFVDDNPAERAIIRQYLPAVRVIELPADPALYVRAVQESLCFEWAQLSREDLVRSDTYVSNRKREDLASVAVSYDDYLNSLEMSARVGVVGQLELSRFSQLINKSNQFNLRTQRYTEAALERLRSSSQDHRLVFVSLSDRFDNYGIISAAILQKTGTHAFIDTWVMSCRVLKRGVEQLMLNTLVAMAREMGCERLTGEYIPTAKNGLVRDLLPALGFQQSLSLAATTATAERYELIVTGFCDSEHLIRT
ncbi:MAG: HAD-IIIC family phosphatase [Vicinamibacterales bacterium]